MNEFSDFIYVFATFRSVFDDISPYNIGDNLGNQEQYDNDCHRAQNFESIRNDNIIHQ